MSSLSLNPPTPSEIQKIKEKITKIQSVIDKQGRYGFYLLIDDQVKLISKGNNKEDLDHDVFIKIAKKRSTIGNFIYLVEVHINEKYISKPIKVAPGPVMLKIKEFIISPRYELIHKAEYTNGALFYNNNDILNGKFHFTDIKELVKEVHDRKIQIANILGINAVKVLESKKG